MNINLTPEQEEIVKEELKSGHFRSAEEVIGKALSVLRDKEGSALADEKHRHDAVREMFNFVENNRTLLRDISVKQLIHEGHRL
jgi:Arc/MetJ-type ribon-helix-helix transcriptional regulator